MGDEGELVDDGERPRRFVVEADIKCVVLCVTQNFKRIVKKFGQCTNLFSVVGIPQLAIGARRRSLRRRMEIARKFQSMESLVAGVARKCQSLESLVTEIAQVAHLRSYSSSELYRGEEVRKVKIVFLISMVGFREEEEGRMVFLSKQNYV